ncbi:MAG TPA: ACT domain-containing protein [Clostridiales bacterium]|nr:ACT domain-containing protein [Clostridiales bacterium]
MKAIVTVLGKDRKGIIAEVCLLLASYDNNILDISQTVMQDFFTMTMLVDTSDCTVSFDELSCSLNKKGEAMGLNIRIQREDLFSAMHRI